MKKMIFLQTFILLLVGASGCAQHHPENGHGAHGTDNTVVTLKPGDVNVQSPKRVAFNYRQTLEAPVEEVFPLYCPVMEGLWAEGWNPSVVYSKSGLVETDCIFKTPGHGEGTGAIWYVTDHDAEKKHVEMLMVMPETVIMKLVIDSAPLEGGRTETTLTRSITSIGQAGDEIVGQYGREEFEQSMKNWEKSMNHYLKTGKLLEGLSGY